MNKSIYVVIPAYNPSSALIPLLHALAAMPFKGIILVNDGSNLASHPIFDEASQIQGVSLLRHAINLGKGQALKTAFNYLLLEHPDMHGVVTADADGQHLSKDILRVGQALDSEENALILGVRSFSGDIPLRSRLGNILTAGIARFLLGKKIQDTQTGLRGISRKLLPELIQLRTGGYDYEMEMLASVINKNNKLVQIEISTVYIDGNKSSHFNPLWDSIAIYYVLLRHIGNSILTAILDFAIFAICYYATGTILFSIFVGRVFAGMFNFSIGKLLVFKSDNSIAHEAIRYSGLVFILMLISYSAVSTLVNVFAVSPYVSKFIVESIIFILSFAVQRIFVFSTSKEYVSQDVRTDWDRYYNSRKRSISTFTRNITKNILLNKLNEYVGYEIGTIVEFGGGDSCFYEAFKKAFPKSKYVVVDSSSVGVAKFCEKANNEVEAICKNVLEPFDRCLGDVVKLPWLVQS